MEFHRLLAARRSLRAFSRRPVEAEKIEPTLGAGARREDAAVVESRDYFLLDTGLAVMSLLYRAVDQGLLVHPMAGWKEGPLRAALGLPEDFTPAAGVAVGYAG